MSSITISKTNKYTFINVFTLHDPANQEKLIDIMSSLMSGPGKSVPGFIASALHRSLDGTKVVVYSQWSTKEAGQSLKDIEELRPYGKQAMELASMTPVMYEVADTFIGLDFKQ
jgi:heme-degrading monooxygenase HmoA